MDQVTSVIERAIIRLLTDYPKLSHTMLRSHIAPYSVTYAENWRDVLTLLVRQGQVIETHSRTGRRTVRNYQLPGLDATDQREYTGGAEQSQGR